MLNIKRAIAHLTKHARDTNALIKITTTATAMTTRGAFFSSLRMDSKFRSSSFVSNFCNDKSSTTTRRRKGGFARKKTRHGSFRRKIFNFAEKLGVCFCRVFWCKIVL